MEHYKELLAQVSNPADLATILLSGVLGFVLDAGLDIANFMSASQSGFMAAAAALGLKKLVESAPRKKLEPHVGTVTAGDVHRRAMELRELLAERARGNGELIGALQTLDQDLLLYRRGLLTASQLQESVSEGLRMLRSMPPPSDVGTIGPTFTQ